MQTEAEPFYRLHYNEQHRVIHQVSTEQKEIRFSKCSCGWFGHGHNAFHLHIIAVQVTEEVLCEEALKAKFYEIEEED